MGSEFTELITDNIVVQENNDFNIQLKEKTFEGGIDSFNEQSIKEEEPNKQIQEEIQPMEEVIENQEKQIEPMEEVIQNQGEEQIMQQGGSTELNTTGAFEISTKQATYPLFSFILNSDTYYKTFRIFLTNSENLGYQQPMERVSDLSQLTDEPEVPIQENNRITRSMTRGGGNGNISENLKKILDSLPKTDLQISLKDIDESNVFKNNNICFHPLFSIYMKIF